MRSANEQPGTLSRDPHAALDSSLWLGLTLLVMVLTPMGLVSGDGIARSAAYSLGTWQWNPNHLLQEPLDAWWQQSLGALGFDRSGVDRLRLLSIVSGSLTLAIFRFGIAAPIAATRFGANFGTVWLALSAGFAALWISDEVFMPHLLLLGVAGTLMVAYAKSGSTLLAAAIGGAFGAAALFFVSDALVAGAMVLALAWLQLSRGGWRKAAATAAAAGGAFIVVLSVPLVAVWAASSSADVGFSAWLFEHHGSGEVGRGMPQLLQGFGLDRLVGGVVHTAYGSARVAVPVVPSINSIVYDREVTAEAVARLLSLSLYAGVLLTAVILTLKRRSEPLCGWFLLATGLWVAGVVVFGLYYSQSDTQFYIQIAIPFAALASSIPFTNGRARLLALLACALVLGWTVRDSIGNIRYPRAERVETLTRITDGHRLVIFPGNDEVGSLIYFVDASVYEERLTLMQVAQADEPGVGFPRLRDAVELALNEGRDVVLINIFDIPRAEQPWKALRVYGYPRDEILSLFEEFPLDAESSHEPPFTVRTISGGQPNEPGPDPGTNP